MMEFCAGQKVERGHGITRDLADFHVLDVERAGAKARLLKIPAPLACSWLGRAELEPGRREDQ